MLGHNEEGTQERMCARGRGSGKEGSPGPKGKCTHWNPRNDATTNKKSLTSGKNSRYKLERGHNRQMKWRQRRSRGLVQTTLRPGKINIGGDQYFGDIRRRRPKSKRIFFQNLGGFPTEQKKLRTALEEVRQFSANFHRYIRNKDKPHSKE